MNFLAIGKYLLGVSLQYWIDPSKSDRTYLAHKKTTGSHWFGHFWIPEPWIWSRNTSILAKFHKLWEARSPSWEGVRGCSLIYFEALDEYYRLRYSFLENRVIKIIKSCQMSRRISENLRSGDVIHPTLFGADFNKGGWRGIPLIVR